MDREGAIKRWSRRIAHQLFLLFEILQDPALRIRTCYAYYHKYTSVRRKTILYESFFGRGMLCNPYAIFQELLADPEFSRYEHIWVLDRPEDHKELIREYQSRRNVRFVRYQSRAYLKYLCRAGYLINNVTFPSYFTKKKGQVYVNTWHGIPLKKLGYDMPNGKTEVSNVVRNLLMSDHLISANPFLTQIYLRSYKMEQLYQGSIIEEGYPRLDLLRHFTREQVLDRMRRYGMEVDAGKKIVLYAPTWKGASYAKADDSVEGYAAFKDALESRIDTSRYQVFVKVHQRVYELAKDRLKGGWSVQASIDANEILSVTDILISDYSSIFYDFLATGRPVLFYITDLDKYQEQRGMYMGPQDLPGPYTDDIGKLAEWIEGIEDVHASYKERLGAQAGWAGAADTGNISKKIVDIVFRGQEDGYAIHREKATKKRILISRGQMRVNGITTALIDLLDCLDYAAWDVTLMITPPKDRNEQELIERIDPNVRVMLRNTTFNMTYLEQIRHRYRMKYGAKDPYDPAYEREVRRAYGGASFDYMIDFDGYNLFYALLTLQDAGAWHGIWMHNDMMREKECRFPWLAAIFGLYAHFDAVISCSREIMEVNRKNLSQYCDAGKFHYARNMIDAARITAGLAADSICTYQGKRYIRVEEDIVDGCCQVRLLPSYESGEDGQPSYTFINIARLSVEKNQEALIRAVARLVQEGVDAHLYILGDGPLRETLSELIADLDLEGRVILAGIVKDPLAVMRHCDCFVLPSLHEGQPMAVHEARAMHMPIILSDFSSVGGVMIEDGQYLVKKGVDDIYEGLRAYIEGRVPTGYHFDIGAYDETAYQEFLRALDL